MTLQQFLEAEQDTLHKVVVGVGTANMDYRKAMDELSAHDARLIEKVREDTVKDLLAAMHAFPQRITPDEVQKCIAENNYAPIFEALTLLEINKPQ